MTRKITSEARLAEANSVGHNAMGELVEMVPNRRALQQHMPSAAAVSSMPPRQYAALSKSAGSHLKCAMCDNLLKDAVIFPCCMQSACDHCVRQKILAGGGNIACPLCEKRGLVPDRLLPNKNIRAAVEDYLMQARFASFSACIRLYV